MFERYTEKARRTIFFARYEAQQLGSPYIETEHLLLGLLREAKNISTDFLKPGGAEAIREAVEARWTGLGEKVSTSSDLPLSNESKRVLAYAAEEAARLSHRHIGTEHIWLGLLREENSFAATLLSEHGVTLAKARVRAKLAPDPGAHAIPRMGGGFGTADRAPRTQPLVTIHGESFSAHFIRNKARQMLGFAWVKQDYQARDVLVEKSTGKVMFYSGQEYDQARFELAKGAWARDRCAICGWELNPKLGPDHQAGYTNGKDWLCTECYEGFVLIRPDPRDDIYT